MNVFVLFLTNRTVLLLPPFIELFTSLNTHLPKFIYISTASLHVALDILHNFILTTYLLLIFNSSQISYPLSPSVMSIVATPVNAISVEGECSFDRNLCGWKNLTKNPIRREGQLAASLNNKVIPSSSPSSSFPKQQSRQADHPLGHRLNSGESITWRMASPNSRPANLQDHTFRAPS